MSGMKIALLGTSALIGPMTAAERQRGRYMRAPDNHGDKGGNDDGGFAEFEKAGEVEVGSTKDAIETNIPEPEEKPAKPAARRGPPKAAAGKEKPAAAAADKAAGKDKPDEGEGDDDDQGEDDGDEEEDDDQGEEDEEDEGAAKKRDRIAREKQVRRLKLERAEAKAEAAALRQEVARMRLEKEGLSGASANGKSSNREAPDPNDTEKYPLGHLDDRYIEDKLEWLAETKAAAIADAALQRQQGDEQRAQAEKAHAELLDKVDDLSTRGSELYDDFQEAVVESGMRGDWRLDQPTFEAAHEAENGAQILYELSQDKKEAARVAELSPYAQMKFVMDRDAEITAKSKPRRIPGAGAPPATQTRGANSRTRISPATDNLDDFEKAWAADAKGKN